MGLLSSSTLLLPGQPGWEEQPNLLAQPSVPRSPIIGTGGRDDLPKSLHRHRPSTPPNQLAPKKVDFGSLLEEDKLMDALPDDLRKRYENQKVIGPKDPRWLELTREILASAPTKPPAATDYQKLILSPTLSPKPVLNYWAGISSRKYSKQIASFSEIIEKYSKLRQQPTENNPPIIFDSAREGENFLNDLRQLGQDLRSINLTDFYSYAFDLIKLTRVKRSSEGKPNYELPLSQEFLAFLVERYKSCSDLDSVFIERLILSQSHLIDQSIAANLLNIAKSKFALSGELAQMILLKHPSLKETYTDRDFIHEIKSMDIASCFSQENIRRASNQAETVCPEVLAKHHHGLEIEAFRFRANCTTGWGSGSVLSRRENKKFFKMNKGRRNKAFFEFRTLKGGFKLNEGNRKQIHELIRDLELARDFGFFGTNHLHVDSWCIAREDFYNTIFQFRRSPWTERPSYETNEAIPSLPFALRETTATSALQYFDINLHFDQMQVISAISEIPTKTALDSMKDFCNELPEEEKQELWKLPIQSFANPISQRIGAKFLAYLAKKSNKESLIPNILRLYSNNLLPLLNTTLLSKFLRFARREDLSKAMDYVLEKANTSSSIEEIAKEISRRKHQKLTLKSLADPRLKYNYNLQLILAKNLQKRFTQDDLEKMRINPVAFVGAQQLISPNNQELCLQLKLSPMIKETLSDPRYPRDMKLIAAKALGSKLGPNAAEDLNLDPWILFARGEIGEDKDQILFNHQGKPTRSFWELYQSLLEKYEWDLCRQLRKLIPDRSIKPKLLTDKGINMYDFANEGKLDLNPNLSSLELEERYGLWVALYRARNYRQVTMEQLARPGWSVHELMEMRDNGIIKKEDINARTLEFLRANPGFLKNFLCFVLNEGQIISLQEAEQYGLDQNLIEQHRWFSTR